MCPTCLKLYSNNSFPLWKILQWTEVNPLDSGSDNSHPSEQLYLYTWQSLTQVAHFLPWVEKNETFWLNSWLIDLLRLTFFKQRMTQEGRGGGQIENIWGEGGGQLSTETLRAPRHVIKVLLVETQLIRGRKCQQLTWDNQRKMVKSLHAWQ